MGFKIVPFGGQKYRGDYADCRDIAQYMGLPRYARIPPDFYWEGELPLTDGRTVLAIYKTGKVSPNGWRGKTAKHRGVTYCPDCAQLVPLGRTHQHVCK